MYKFTKKQIIVAGIIVILICIGIYYYLYAERQNSIIEKQEDLETYTNEEKSKEDTKENKIVVHVSGAVNKEGIIELDSGSRISDAIERMGGLKADANITDINLAYKLEDGMKIYIPTNKEVEENNNNNISEYLIPSQENTIKDKNNNSTSNKAETNKKVNINNATQAELETLPNIGPSTALKIINYRKENGKFKNVEELKNVKGIGEQKFNQIRNLITV